MPKFGHIENGQVIDVQENNSQDEYLKRYSPGITKSWSIVQDVEDKSFVKQGGGYDAYVAPEIVLTQPDKVPTEIEVLQAKIDELTALIKGK